MYKKSTAELEKILGTIPPDGISDFVADNLDEIMTGDRDFMRYMNEKFKEKKLRKNDILLKADISEGYGYKLLTEEKFTKQRDVILRICYAANFTLEETQQALTLYRMHTLYARDTRDALLMTCFNERPGSILEVNEILAANKLSPLRTSGAQD